MTPLLLALELVGVFVFALDGTLTALRVARLDLVGVVTVGMATALGGGVVRDILIGAVPPATFTDWRYLVVATVGGLMAYAVGRHLERLSLPISLLDAAGVSLFAVTGTSKALDFGLGAGQAIILGTMTAVGGGMVRDVLLRRIPVVLHSGLFVIPVVVGSVITVAASLTGLYGLGAAVVAAAMCFSLRALGILLELDAPRSPAATSLLIL
jgi:uncharacterized membrane protein YeiH